MDRFPTVFGSENEQLAEVLREIVRKRDNDATQVNQIEADLSAINTSSIQEIAALPDITDPGLLSLQNGFYTIFENDFVTNANTQQYFSGVAVNSGTSTFGGTDINHIGHVTFISAAGADSGYRLASASAAMYLAGSEQFDCIFYPLTLTNSTHRFGFHDASTVADANDGCYFELSSTGALIGKTANNGTRSSTPTIATLSATTWYHGRIIINSSASLVTYQIYSDAGTLLGSATLSTNIPATTRATGFGYIATESAGATQDLVRVDYMRVGIGRKLVRGAFQ